MNNFYDRSDQFDKKERESQVDNNNPHKLRALIDYSRKLEEPSALRISLRSTEVITELISIFDQEYLESDELIRYSDLYTRAKGKNLPLSLYLQCPLRLIHFSSGDEWRKACKEHGKVFRAVSFDMDSDVDYSDLIACPIVDLGIFVDVGLKVENMDFARVSAFINDNCRILASLKTLKTLRTAFVFNSTGTLNDINSLYASNEIFKAIATLPSIENIVLPNNEFTQLSLNSLKKKAVYVKNLVVHSFHDALAIDDFLALKLVDSLTIIYPCSIARKREGYDHIVSEYGESIYTRISK